MSSRPFFLEVLSFAGVACWALDGDRPGLCACVAR